MSHNRNLARLPAATMSGTLHTIAAGMREHGMGQNSRSLALSTKDPLSFFSEDEDEDEDTTDLKYLPAPTTEAWFRFNGNHLKFNISQGQPSMSSSGGQVTAAVKGDVTLSCFSLMGNVEPIKQFLEHLRASTKSKQTAMLNIWRMSGKHLSRVSRPARGLDSVAMSAAVKEQMIEDMKDYLGSRNWYAERGMPWRRGYLMYGPPGTGKTSIATAVAGHFSIPLYMLSLPSMNDASLQDVFDRLPSKCVVLLEDIDSAGVGREDMAMSSMESDHASHHKRGTLGVTLSGLLNAIDGPASHEGRILICTTNSPDSLDAALIRPGRIDMKILFGNATTEVIERLFVHIFENPTGERTKYDCDVARMAKSFAALVPDGELTPAEVQSFLVVHRNDPSKVLEGAEAWAQKLLATKRQGVNVESFKGQV